MAVENNLDDAKLLTVNSGPPLVDRHEDVHTSQRRTKSAQKETEMAENWFQVLSGAMKKTQKNNSSHGLPGENKTVPLKI